MLLLQFVAQPSTAVLATGPNDILAFIFKVMLIILAFFYVMFAGLVIRQVSIMRRTLETPFSPMLQILSYIHLFIAGFVFFVFLIVL